LTGPGFFYFIRAQSGPPHFSRVLRFKKSGPTLEAAFFANFIRTPHFLRFYFAVLGVSRAYREGPPKLTVEPNSRASVLYPRSALNQLVGAVLVLGSTLHLLAAHVFIG